MFPLKPSDTLLCVLPLAHVFGFVCGLLWGLSCGACVAMGSGSRGIFTDFARLRPTAVSLVPAQLAYVLKAKTANEELATVLVGAGDCPPELIENTRALGLQLSFGYGLTETSSGVAISTGGDPFAMDICPDDKIMIARDGEVLIYAPTCVMEGYYKDPESTAAAFVELPENSGVDSAGIPDAQQADWAADQQADRAADPQTGTLRWLKSGDLGCLDEDGRLHITGRKKDMLVLSDGTKLFLPEYEGRLSALLETGELAVFLEGNAPALLLQETERDEKAVRAAIRPLMEELPRGRQIGSIWFSDDPMPRTATGKIRRWELETIKKEKRP
jgi:long-subunit acyl-CoA synthetase (AMP-forming)